MTSTVGEVVYIIESNHVNKFLWKRESELRDNGVLTIGTCIAILNPLPIKALLGGKVPIIESRGSCIILKTPVKLKQVPLNPNIDQEATHAFVLNGMKLDILYSYPLETNCSGSFCDRQRVVEVLRSGRGCGCYSMISRKSRLVIAHDLIISKTDTNIDIEIESFSSLKFSKFYLDGNLPQKLTFLDLDNTKFMRDIRTSIEKCVNYINSNGGWTVVGWYKKGVSNDVSNAAQAVQVDSSEISYHAVKMYPSVPATSSNYGQHLQTMKYDTSNLEATGAM